MDITSFIRSLLTVTQLGAILLGACIALPAVRVRLPEFEAVPTKITQKKGDKARLYCSVKHLGERTVVWRRVTAKNPLTIGTRTWIDDPRITVDRGMSDNQWDLIIQGVSTDDAGKYECQVSVSKKILRHVVDLEVKESQSFAQVKRNPEILISGSQFVTSGENISLYCNVTVLESPERELAWFKDTEKVEEDDERITLSYVDASSSYQVSSHLHIQSAVPDDSGLYTCRTSDRDLMTSAHVSVLSGGSNNVKRAGSMTGPQESKAVLSVQTASSHSLFVLSVLLVHRLLT